MMHAKALYFHDAETAALIMASTDPKAQKTLGRTVANWDDSLWEKIRERVVYEGNWWKFSGNPAYRDILLATGERMLVEYGG